jgi:anaerobic ribonucleoside-triphosphate reductase activating protein
MKAIIQYNAAHRALEVYTVGCTIGCKNCHNPELQDFRKEVPNIDYVTLGKKASSGIVDKLWILGGEPMQQNIGDLLELIFFGKEYGLEVWLFTSYEFNEIDYEIRTRCDYIKCGPYIESLPSYVRRGITLASFNQYIRKVVKEEEEEWL